MPDEITPSTDPTEGEPAEDTLPEKPGPEVELPPEGDEPLTDAEESEVDVPEPEDQPDPTVDDLTEPAEEPHTDLPEGTRAEDYDD